MKIWVDDLRPAPERYVWAKSVNEAKAIIQKRESRIREINFSAKMLTGQDHKNAMEAIKVLQIELIDMDHDAGDYATSGGDYIKLLDWLEETGRSYPIRIHSMNPVGVQNMRNIIQKNGWKEVR